MLNNPDLLCLFFDNLPIQPLDPDIAKELEDEIALEEIKEAIKWMQRDKSPEFYKKFSNSLSPLLRDMYIDSFNNKTLRLTLGQATI